MIKVETIILNDLLLMCEYHFFVDKKDFYPSKEKNIISMREMQAQASVEMKYLL